MLATAPQEWLPDPCGPSASATYRKSTRTPASAGQSISGVSYRPICAVGACNVQEEYQNACKRTERAESEALSAEVALRDERVQNKAAAAKLQDEVDKCGLPGATDPVCRTTAITLLKHRA